jgi:hypothetical protein
MHPAAAVSNSESAASESAKCLPTGTMPKNVVHANTTVGVSAHLSGRFNDEMSRRVATSLSTEFIKVAGVAEADEDAADDADDASDEDIDGNSIVSLDLFTAHLSSPIVGCAIDLAHTWYTCASEMCLHSDIHV